MHRTYGPIAIGLTIALPMFLIPQCFSELSFVASLLRAWFFGCSTYLVASQIVYLHDRGELPKAEGSMSDSFWVLPPGLRQEVRLFLFCFLAMIVLDFWNFPFLVLIPLAHIGSVILMRSYFQRRGNQQ